MDSSDKSDRMYSSQKRKCPVCLQQLPLDHTTTDLALYVKETGNLKISTEQTCLKCKEEMISIRKHVDQEHLSFGKDSQLFKTLLEPFVCEKYDLHLNQPSIYQKYVELEIKRNKMYHCSHLPQSCRQLIYYSSFSVHQAERHERIKHTISRIMEATSLPFDNLIDLSILVQCLSCYMHENNVIKIFKAISDMSLKYGHLYKEQSNNQYPYDVLYEKLYKNGQITDVVMMIWVLLNNWEKFPQVIKEMEQNTNGLGGQRIKNLIKEKKEEKKINGIQCLNCERNKIQSMIEIEKMKNNFIIVCKEMKKEEEAIRQYINQIQLKFYKEKEEFINKIIKLKDKITCLEEGELQYRPRSSSDPDIKTQKKYKKLTSSMIKEVSEKSESTIRTEQKIEENRNSNETEEMRRYQTKSLQEVLTCLPEFDPNMLSEETSEKSLIGEIEKGIIKMKSDIFNLEKKSKTHQNDAKRLLEILTKKQERFVPLLHEKDIIIERYEDALWRMENNLQVQDEILTPRIQKIMANFKNKYSDHCTEENTTVDEKREERKSEKKQQKKEEKGVKKKKKSGLKKKEKKEQQKQCSIY